MLECEVDFQLCKYIKEDKNIFLVMNEVSIIINGKVMDEDLPF